MTHVEAAAVGVTVGRWLIAALGPGCAGHVVGVPSRSPDGSWRVSAEVLGRDAQACLSALRFPSRTPELGLEVRRVLHRPTAAGADVRLVVHPVR